MGWMNKYVVAFCFCLLFLPFWSQESSSQETYYGAFFEDLLKPAPDSLSWDYFYGLPKFRCVFHDSFDRLREKPNRESVKYSVANDTLLGRNAFSNTKYYEYYDIRNASFHIGVNDKSFAFNSKQNGRNQRIIKCVNTGGADFGFLFRRNPESKYSARIAFKIKDIDNFYYVSANKKRIELFLIKEGKTKRLLSLKHHGGRSFFGLIVKNGFYLYSDYHYLGCIELEDYLENTQSGLLFIGDQRSEIGEFAIYRQDKFYDNHFDDFVEKGDVPNEYATFGCEKGLIKFVTTKTAGSNRALRFELTYYPDWEKHKIGGNRRSEINPNAVTAAALDSWICSFDVYFPGVNDGEEYYASDKLDELFWQMHTPSNINMLSPNVALYVKNGIIRFEALSRSVLRNDREGVKSNLDYDFSGVIGTISDKEDESSDFDKIERGRWHNFTIFVKEGYTESQLPRSIVYLDGRKVIDWFIPNVQNCGFPWTYMQFGIYKWPWANSRISSTVTRRVLYFDNIKYIR